MNENNNITEATRPTAATKNTSSTSWETIWPAFQPIATAIINAIERTNQKSSNVTAWLLGLVIACLTSMATICLFLGRMDTAEKIIIAMVSFLGGAAVFSGPSKK